MATFTGTNNRYSNLSKLRGDKLIGMASDVWKLMLTTSSYTPDSDAHTILSDVTNEAANYTQITLGTLVWSITAGVTKFDFENPVVTASGGDCTARYWVIYNDTVATPVKPLLAWGLIDDAPADVVIANGDTLTLNVNASGLFTIP